MRYERALSTALCIAALALGCGGPQEPVGPQGGDCGVYRTQVEVEWNSEVKAALRARLVSATGGISDGAQGQVGWSESSYLRIENEMDRLSEDWTRMRTMLCLDHQRQTLPAEDYARRTECLDRWLQGLRTAVSLGKTEGANPDDVAAAFAQVAQSSCSAAGGGETRVAGAAPQDPRALAAHRTRGMFLAPDAPERASVLEGAEVEVAVMQKVGENTTRVYPYQELRSGDQFYLNVQANREIFVYIMYVGPDDRAELLYPPEGAPDARVAAGDAVRMPPEHVIELDDTTGLEQLFVITSRRPLSELGDDTFSAVNSVRENHALPGQEQAAAPPDAEPGDYFSQVRTRGLRLVRDDDVVVAAADDDGVSVTPFPLQHLPR